MKPEEAIERLEYLESALDGYPPETGINDVFAAIDTAIKALEEIQQYRETGTVEKCRAAVEKLSVKIVSDLDYDLGYYTCPSCGITISFMDDGHKSHKCCLNCGQAIQFYENLEGMEE